MSLYRSAARPDIVQARTEGGEYQLVQVCYPFVLERKATADTFGFVVCPCARKPEGQPLGTQMAGTQAHARPHVIHVQVHGTFCDPDLILSIV